MWPKRLLLLAHPFVGQREGAGAPRVGRLVARDRPSESEPSASSPPGAISRHPPARTGSRQTPRSREMDSTLRSPTVNERGLSAEQAGSNLWSPIEPRDLAK